MGKYIWAWGYDGTVLYVYEVYKPKFRRYHRLRQVKYFYTSSFDDVQAVAEEFIARLEAVTPTNNPSKGDAER